MSDKLTMRTKLGFGVGDMGGNLYFTLIAFWLFNYLTDTVGLLAGLAGTVIMIGKIWDAVTDPVLGFISDRTRSRWGRRRPYLLFGAAPFGIAVVIMFINPGLSGQTALFIWAVVVFCILSAAFTVVNIPYSALTPELTQDYHERTTLNGYRSIFMVVGTLLGAGAALPLINAFSNKNTGYTVMGIVFGLVITITTLITFFSVREPEGRALPKMGFLKTYSSVFKNKPYRIIVLTYMTNIMAITIVSGIMVYYFKYIFDDEPMTTMALMILLVIAMAIIPVSVLIAKKIGKKLTYAIGMLVIALICLIIFFIGHLIDPTYFLILMGVAGIGLGLTYALPWSMVPDTVEYGYVETGERQEGGYYGIWTFMTKIGQALALLLMGWMLTLTGYVAEVVQSDSARLGIRLLLGVFPAFFYILAVVILAFYPLNEERYGKILDKVKEMEAKE